MKKNEFAPDEMFDNKEATRQRQIKKMLELDKEKEQLLSTIEASKKNFGLQRTDKALRCVVVLNLSVVHAGRHGVNPLDVPG